MKVLITGICGFVGSTLATALASQVEMSLIGIDNFSRPGSELNRERLLELGIDVRHGDIRVAADLEAIPDVDWIIDAAANPSVLAGVDGVTSSRQLVEHNLSGTINLLEFCKRNRSGFTLISTSRVYSIAPLSQLKLIERDSQFVPDDGQEFPSGLSVNGISESFSTLPPVSLYGSTKVASEHLALEYGATFGFPVWINRCGVLAGASQFGHPAQGIFSFWVHSFREKSALRYIGFGGTGLQVRDCLHPLDLVPVLYAQIKEPLDSDKPRICNFGGGPANSMSLLQLTNWCEERFGNMQVAGTDTQRPFDIGWMVLDCEQAASVWGWEPTRTVCDILEEIAQFAEEQPDWLRVSNPVKRGAEQSPKSMPIPLNVPIPMISPTNHLS